MNEFYFISPTLCVHELISQSKDDNGLISYSDCVLIAVLVGGNYKRLKSKFAVYGIGVVLKG